MGRATREWGHKRVEKGEWGMGKWYEVLLIGFCMWAGGVFGEGGGECA